MNESNINNNTVICLLWNRPILLCEEFINETNLYKFCSYEEENGMDWGNEYSGIYDLTPLIMLLVTDAIKIFELNCLRYKQYNTNSQYNMKNIVDNIYLQKRIDDIILFFSECYKNNTTPSTLWDLFEKSCSTTELCTMNNIIRIWLFFTLKDTLLIDERMLCIQAVHNTEINSRNFEDISNYMIHKFTALFDIKNNSGYIFCYDICFLSEGICYISLEIIRQIEKSKMKLSFVNKLRRYNEFTYFIKNSNPQLGKLTYLRFL